MNRKFSFCAGGFELHSAAARDRVPGKPNTFDGYLIFPRPGPVSTGMFGRVPTMRPNPGWRFRGCSGLWHDLPPPWEDIFGPLRAGSVDDLVVVGQIGQSLDGRIATMSGHSRYINGPAGLAHLHRLRALVDAVIVGVGSALADDPRLDGPPCRGADPGAGGARSTRQADADRPPVGRRRRSARYCRDGAGRDLRASRRRTAGPAGD